MGTFCLHHYHCSTACTRPTVVTYCSTSSGDVSKEGKGVKISHATVLGIARIVLWLGIVRRVMDLARLGRKCFVSQNALGEILTWAKQNPDTLAELGRAREDACDISTSYGKLLQEMTLRGKTGHEIKVAYLAPAAMLQHVRDSAAGKARSVRRPETIVLYSDEVSPGNQLKHTNRRKLQVVHELGSLRLTKESSWFVLTAVRTETVNSIAGWPKWPENASNHSTEKLQTSPQAF